VIDPVYSLLLLAALVAALVKGARSFAAQHLVLLGLALTSLYVGLGWGQNLRAERLAAADLEAREVPVEEVHAYTTLFSPWLRRLVAVTPEAHLVGFVSTLKPQPIDWREVPRDPAAEALAAAIGDTRAAEVYVTFANGPRHAERRPHDGNPVGGQELRLYDLRFGFPNGALTGLWGMVAVVDAERRLVEARRFSVDTDIAEGDITAMLRAKLGLEQQLF
jgi:inner membrane protein